SPAGIAPARRAGAIPPSARCRPPCRSLFRRAERAFVFAELLDRLVCERKIDHLFVRRDLALRDVADTLHHAAVAFTRFGVRPWLASQMHFCTMKSSDFSTTSCGSLVYLTMIGMTLARSV